MKYLISILLLFISFQANAVNYLGFGGGNYVYAEQGNLYFNIDEYAFDNRAWTYDGQKFTSQISIKMDLKTKYTSDWYEQVLVNKKSDGFMYANYIKHPFHYQNRGDYQKVFWQRYAAAAVGGQIVRTASFGAFKGFIKNNFPKFAATVIGSYFISLGVADSVNCESGDCKQTVEYMYVSKVVNPSTQQVVTTNTIYATRDEYVSHEKLIAVVQSKLKPVNSNGSTLEYCNVNVNVNCYYKRPSPQTGYDGYAFSWSTLPSKLTEERLVQDRDLLKYFDEVCAKFPSECINEPSDGKKINDVQLTAGSISGGVSVTGPPYTNPITGKAEQDQVVIGGTNSGIGVPSSTNNSWFDKATLGQSAISNTVTVTTTARPDLTNTGEAEVAKPNEQTGTKPQVVVPPITVPEFKDLNDMIDFCKANPNALSCVEVEQVDESKIEIPQVTENLNLQVKNYITSSSGACPQGSTFSVSMFGVTQTAEFSFTPACQFANYLKYAVWAAAWLLAAQIVMGRNQS